MTTVTFPDPTIRRATATLNFAVRSWFVVAFLGQLIFAFAVASFYGLTAARGDLHRWSIGGGWKPGDVAGNLSIAMHLATAVIVMTSGCLQLIPRLRARHPRFHRWNGRLYVTAGLLLSAAGTYMTWFRSRIGDVPQHLASTLNAVLIWAFAAIAVRYAIRRDFAAHRRWALRFFLVLSASYFYRLSFFLVVALAGHPVGFDPTTFTGWLPTTMSFTQYLLPLGALELYLRAQANPNAFRRFATAGVLFVMTLATAAGIAVVTAANWLPDVRHGFDSRPSIAEALSSTIEKHGIDAALRQYRELKAARGATYNFDEAELNSLGYQYLRRKQMTDAIRIFQLNVEAYPKSSNAYDSLGEAFADAGNKTQAIAYYQKAVVLNPKNYNAAGMLQKLRGRA
jgi:tetratricopeptide (TPR) repeat protein